MNCESSIECQHQFRDGIQGYECELCGYFYEYGDAPWEQPVTDVDCCNRCDGSGFVPTMDFESYFGDDDKPCPDCGGCG